MAGSFSVIRSGTRLMDQNLDLLSRALQPQPVQWTLVGQKGGPAFQNSWINFDGNGAPKGRDLRFTLDSLGYVVIMGQIKGGTPSATSVAFNLPAGLRPGRNIRVPIEANSAFGAAGITTAGDVIVIVGSTIQTNLDGIRFLAEL